MSFGEFLQPAFWIPMAKCGGAALVLWLAVWWREREAQGPLPLVVLGVLWVGCHLTVNYLSYVIPPKEAVDWLMAGGVALAVVALASGLLKWRPAAAMVLAAVLLAVVASLALRQMPFLLDRAESPEDRRHYIAISVGAVVVVFFSAELAVRRIHPAAVLGGLSILTVLSALGLWRMESPVRMIARPLAVGAMAMGGTLAACVLHRTARLPPGVAGWIAGGLLILFTFVCLTRPSDVPVVPIGVAAAALPAAALLLVIYRRLFSAGYGLTFLAATVLAGSAVFWASAREQLRKQETPAAAVVTGADDTGAYD